MGLSIKDLGLGRGGMDRIMILLNIATGNGPGGQKDYFTIEKERRANPTLAEGEEITPVSSGNVLELETGGKIVQSYTKAQITANKAAIRNVISLMPQGSEPGANKAAVKIKGKKKGSTQILTIDSRWITKSTAFGGAPPSGPKQTPDTATQEAVTLKIFEHLLKGGGVTPSTNEADALKEFKKLASTKLKRIWPSINNGTRETKVGQEVLLWYNSFFLQYKEIRDTTKLPNNTFDVYLYGGEGSFMKFISDVAMRGPKARARMSQSKTWPNFGPISAKDSWNPADIWLVNKKAPNYQSIMNRIEDAQYIKQINDALIEAFKGTGTPRAPNNPVIAGISLKKASPGVLKYELVNLTMKAGVIPDLRYVTTLIKMPFDESAGRFTKGMGATLDVVEKIPQRTGNGFTDGHKGKMRIGTGGGNDLNLEFGEPGAAAQLGKLPRDVIKKRLQAIRGPLANIVMPNSIDARKMAPKSEDDANATILGDKIKLINSHVGTGGAKNLFTWNDKLKDIGRGDRGSRFIRNMVQAWDVDKGRFLGDAGQKALIAMQVIEWIWILAVAYDTLGNRARFDNLIEDMYYYAQKKGKQGTSRFGPFGKLH